MGELTIAPEVRDAIASDRAVVALESTLVAHGLPWPTNLEVGRAAESAVRAEGAVPATVAVLAGRLTIGVNDAELERIARGHFRKANQSDLSVAIAQGSDAATTVSATAFAAVRAGIALFATGGIGGVHRGGANDVSCDLTTLGREPIVVVSAGPKAILDLPRTLEALETLGVLVLGFATSELPAFYVRGSGLALEHRVDDARSAAQVIRARRALGDRAGVLIANPIPEEEALDESLVKRAIEQALREADAARVTGKALTPFLLSQLARITEAKSLAANRALVLHNCRVAARIAVELSRGS